MRIWSLHPRYLDAKGLVALWRESLLAKHVLEGKTKGYKNHPQLARFKKAKSPNDTINQYLAAIYTEATKRGYKFDKGKINWNFKRNRLNVTAGQLDYEFSHLLKKLRGRDREKHRQLKLEKMFDTHPLFRVVDGEIEEWEIVTDIQ